MRRSRSIQIEILERAAASSQCAGVVKYELAQLYSVRGQYSADHLAALRLHAVNRERYPRFYRGRYRLGMSLEMMANPHFRFTDRATTQRELDEILRVLSRCGLTVTAPVRGLRRPRCRRRRVRGAATIACPAP